MTLRKTAVPFSARYGRFESVTAFVAHFSAESHLTQQDGFSGLRRKERRSASTTYGGEMNVETYCVMNIETMNLIVSATKIYASFAAKAYQKRKG